MVQTTQKGDYRLAFGLLLAALLLFCIDLNGLPLRDWDEGTVAQVAREISQGESWSAWLYPTLWGDPYLNKPPLLHWLIALIYRVWGVHAWTARLPGAVLSAFSVPLLFVLGKEIFPTRLPALSGALVYLTLLPVVRHGRLAMLDGAMVCFFLATLWALLKARHHPQWSLGISAGFACMLLTKGILGVLLMAIALIFLMWDKPKQILTSRLWLGILIGIIPATGWYFLQWLHYGQEFIDTAVISQSVDRIWDPVDRHAGPLWYYLLEIMKTSWPWLVFWPTGLQLSWQSRHQTWAKLILVWTFGYLLVISVMVTKLPWYVFPVYPAIAFTVGTALTAAWNMHRHWNRRSLAIKELPKAWGVAFMLLSAVSVVGTIYASPWGEEPSVGLAATFLTLSVTTILTTLYLARQQVRFLPMLFLGLYLSLVGLMSSDHWIWELGEDFPVLPVSEVIRLKTPPGQVIYTSHSYERPSLNFHSNRRVKALCSQKQDTGLRSCNALLLEQWQREERTYLLVQDISAYRDGSRPVTELGMAEEWHLIVNQ